MATNFHKESWDTAEANMLEAATQHAKDVAAAENRHETFVHFASEAHAHHIDYMLDQIQETIDFLERGLKDPKSLSRTVIGAITYLKGVRDEHTKTASE